MHPTACLGALPQPVIWSSLPAALHLVSVELQERLSVFADEQAAWVWLQAEEQDVLRFLQCADPSGFGTPGIGD